MNRRKPAAVAEKDGSWKKNPQRRRVEPQANGDFCFKPPKRLSKEEKQVWKEVLQKVPRSILKDADEDAFELLVNLILYSRNTTVENATISKLQCLIKMFSEFGMTPYARTKMAVTVGSKKNKVENPFEIIKKETDKLKQKSSVEGLMLQ